jgi:chemotaxis protein methyltransferase CheR
MSEEYLEKIREWVFRHSRLYFPGHKLALLRQRLRCRMVQLGLDDYRAYWERLQQAGGEQLALLDLLTTNESSFFRDPGQFRHLQEAILPELEQGRGRELIRSWGSGAAPAAGKVMKLRILCAGCSRGEEPYSVAISLLEGLRYPKAWDLEIVAGDLSQSCLESARAGFYPAERLKGIPERLRQKYFTPTEGGAVVADELRQLVTILPLNLNDLMNGEPAPGTGGEPCFFDIIFCRNVMIYFAPSCQQRLVETLYRLLVPGGYLLTGDAEPLHLFSHDFVALPDAGCLIYRKMERLQHAI